MPGIQDDESAGKGQGILAIGTIRTSHGVKGLVKVRSFSGETEHFFDLEEVTLKDKRGRMRIFAVERVVPNGEEILMKLKGIDTPEMGKSYAGWEIWVPREKAAPCREGEFYYADLVGCAVVHGDDTLGSVLALTEGGGGTLLEIERPDGGERFFVPFRREFIGQVNVSAKTVELLELWVAGE
jgi:16S rRNA processing protein RimM